jgi:hypothetical protein
MSLFNCINYVFLLLCIIVMYSYYVCVFLFLCMLRSRYSVSLYCSVYCLCVNVYCTAATGCQPIAVNNDDDNNNNNRVIIINFKCNFKIVVISCLIHKLLKYMTILKKIGPQNIS